MEKDLISVVVCIFNREKYLEKCIESIVNQTYKNLEIILIDDGSTDNSFNICKKYEKKDGRIKVFSQENKGIAYSRNLGVTLANGKYFCFCDSDDYYDKDYCKLLYNNLIENNSDFSMCDIMQHDIINNKEYLIDKKRSSFVAEKKELLDLLFEERRLGNPINKLYKTQLLKKCKYPNNNVNEDTYIIYDLLQKCQKISYIDIPLYHRVIHGNSIMSNINKNRLDEIAAFEHWMYGFKKCNDIKHYQLALIRVMDSIINYHKLLKKILSEDEQQELYKKFKSYYKNINIKISIKKKIKYFCYLRGLI